MSIFETTYSDAGEYTFVAGRNRSSVVLYVNGMCPCKQCFDCISLCFSDFYVAFLQL